ncbi:hypothetical protein [Streptomyces chartreusis]|uniref:hypothetical protein n=1 Tax=Streptomyces chartreusis TaxID=1969 RepID=UPI0038004EB5
MNAANVQAPSFNVSIQSIAERETHGNTVTVTLKGEYAGLKDGWAVYAMGREMGGTSQARSANTKWKLEKATLNKGTKTWSAEITVENVTALMTWSAALVPESSTETSSSACSDLRIHCVVLDPKQDLREYGPASSLVEAAAEPRITWVGRPLGSAN